MKPTQFPDTLGDIPMTRRCARWYRWRVRQAEREALVGVSGVLLKSSELWQGTDDLLVANRGTCFLACFEVVSRPPL